MKNIFIIFLILLIFTIFTGCRKNDEEEIEPITFTIKEIKGKLYSFKVQKDGFYYIELSEECTFTLNGVEFTGNKTGMFFEKDKGNIIYITKNKGDIDVDDIVVTVYIKK